MLGDQVGELTGQTISSRVLPDEGSGPRLEVTDQQVGTLCGVQVTQTVTYLGTMRPNGTIAGSGTGLVMSGGGDAATFRGTGVGRFTRPGVVSWRGAIFYETTSQALDRLNGIATVFEYQVDEGGKSEGKLFEWK
jgi:hypothetical protein